MSDSNSKDELPESEASEPHGSDAASNEAGDAKGDDEAHAAGDDHGHGHGAPPGEKKHYFDYPENVDKVIRWFYGAAGLLLVADVFVKFFHVPFHHHATFPEDATLLEGSFETWPFFYAFYGFAACVLLVLAATQLRKVIMRREDYYDRK